MMREVEEEEYGQRMEKAKLMSLVIRRLRSDLIEVYKIMHNFEGLAREDFFPLRSAPEDDINMVNHQYVSQSSTIALTPESAFSHKRWSASGTGYQLQPFMQIRLTGSKPRQTQC